ncbi:MAG: mevalonate kinase [Gammaproteobacteria bacterium]
MSSTIETIKKNIHNKAAVTIRAPGKLILSGEHAVVYGNPGLAMAINYHLVTRVTANSWGKYFVNITEVAQKYRFDYFDLLAVKSDKTLRRPINLIQYAIIIALDHLKIGYAHADTLGLEFKIDSNLPIGAGLGSSAALIISVMKGLFKFFNVSVHPEQLLELAKQAEDMQHGKSSGLDLFMSLMGGVYHYQGQTRTPLSFPKDWNLWMINTGRSRSTTAECVQAVAPHMNPERLKAFECVTEKMHQAILKTNAESFSEAIFENQVLLNEIGIVPEKVQNLIAELKADGIPAKICGAGHVGEGDRAGAVLAFNLSPDWILKFTESSMYRPYTLHKVEIEPHGAMVIV